MKGKEGKWRSRSFEKRLNRNWTRFGFSCVDPRNSTALSDEESNEIRVGWASSLRSSKGTWGLVGNE